MTRIGELRSILQLGWPMVLTQLFIMATGFLDTAMAGHYSSVDLAGVSVGSSLLWPLFMLMTGITMALTPIVSQLQGGGKTAQVGHQTRQGLWICALTSTLLVMVLLNARSLLDLAGIEATTTQIAADYLHAVAWGIPPVVFYVALRHTCEGLGNTRPPMLIAGSVLPANAFFNYAFIYGEFGFPQLGGVGCGYATAIVFWIELGLMMLVMRQPFFRLTGALSRFEWPNLRTIASITRIGTPIGITVFLEMAFYSIISILVARIGVNEVAGHSIAGNLNWLTFVIPMSLGSAASIRVGFHVGSSNYGAARQASATVYRFSIGYAVIVSALLVTLRYHLIGMYTTDPAVIEIAATLLLFIAVYQIVDDSQAVTVGALRGYKDTQMPMLISLVGFWILALPVGYALANGLLLAGLAPGVYGYWSGLTLGLTVVAICVGIRLWRTSADHDKVRKLAGEAT